MSGVVSPLFKVLAGWLEAQCGWACHLVISLIRWVLGYFIELPTDVNPIGLFSLHSQSHQRRIWQHSACRVATYLSWGGKRTEWEGIWLFEKQVFRFLLDSSVFSLGSPFWALTGASKLRASLSQSLRRVALLPPAGSLCPHSGLQSIWCLWFQVPWVSAWLQNSLTPSHWEVSVYGPFFSTGSLMTASATDYGQSEAVWLLKVGHRKPSSLHLAVPECSFENSATMLWGSPSHMKDHVGCSGPPAFGSPQLRLQTWRNRDKPVPPFPVWIPEHWIQEDIICLSLWVVFLCTNSNWNNLKFPYYYPITHLPHTHAHAPHTCAHPHLLARSVQLIYSTKPCTSYFPKFCWHVQSAVVTSLWIYTFLYPFTIILWWFRENKEKHT